MIVILCKSWKAACEAYRLFLDFLEDNEPWSIRGVDKHGNCVETDDDLRYVFVDYRMEHVFDDLRPDVIDLLDFFEGINELYFYDKVINYYDL